MEILFYGSAWCSDCIRSISYLDTRGINYTYIDLETNEQAAGEVVRINKGLQSIPTIIFPNGKILVEPSNTDLELALKENGL